MIIDIDNEKLTKTFESVVNPNLVVELGDHDHFKAHDHDHGGLVHDHDHGS